MMVARVGVIGVMVVLAACGGSLEGVKLEGGGPVGWQFADVAVPKGIAAPIVDGGILLNSHQGQGRAVVTVVFPSAERSRLEAVYDDWAAVHGGVRSGRGFDVGGRVAWQDSWEAGPSEVRMSECLNELSGEFDNLCVALTTRVGSVP